METKTKTEVQSNQQYFRGNLLFLLICKGAPMTYTEGIIVVKFKMQLVNRILMKGIIKYSCLTHCRFSTEGLNQSLYLANSNKNTGR